MLYFAFREVPELAKKNQALVANLVYQQVVWYWQIAPIQTVSIPTVNKKILKLIK